MIEFFVPQEPQGKQTGRAVKIGGFTRIASHPKTKKYEAMVSMIATQAMAGQPPVDEAVTIAVTAILGVPASWSLKKQRAALAGLVIPTRKPDGSNIVKAIEDGCKGIVFRDDALVSDGSWSKRFGLVPGVRVQVWPTVPACQLIDAAPELVLEAA